MKISKSIKMPTAGAFTAVWMCRITGFTTSKDLLWFDSGLYDRCGNGFIPVEPASFIVQDAIYITEISDEDE